jgi:hypothetical protein
MRLLAALAAATLVLTGLGPLAAADPPFALHLFCDDDGPDATGFPMLEASYLDDEATGTGGGCWGHGGMHQYFVGRDAVYALHSGSGHLFSVEQHDSVPTEPGEVGTDPPHVNTSLPVETSLDGLAWQLVTNAQYSFFRLGGPPDRQDVYFSFTAGGEPFRFLRVRQPESAAQGLAGYLDFSMMDVNVTVVGPAPDVPLSAQQGVARSCTEDILEDVFATHACFYGGLNHWDAPSFLHTYFLGDSRLDRVQGTAMLLFFRPWDPGGCCGEDVPLGMLDGALLVQTSVDGAAFDTVARVPVGYGTLAPFDAPGLAGHPAKFVRLVAEKHPGFSQNAALKHPEAYLMYSDLTLDGELPG